MAYIIKDGKAIQVVTNDIKIPKNIIDKVDNNKHSKEIIKKAVKSIKKAKDYIALHKIAAVTTATTAAAGENIKSGL